jgi:tRNA (cytidine/uridine-2'-O-)-methyltransferase
MIHLMKHKLAIVLFQPEIPPNTGNIIRLCANTRCELHLIKPLGFPLEDTKLRRAGLDYHEYANLVVHDDYQACRNYFGDRRIIAVETCGTKHYHEVNFLSDDVLLFGSETKGLPTEILNNLRKEDIVRLPMYPSQRSLNLSNSVAIVVYEVWRQLSFIGGV